MSDPRYNSSSTGQKLSTENVANVSAISFQSRILAYVAGGSASTSTEPLSSPTAFASSWMPTSSPSILGFQDGRLSYNAAGLLAPPPSLVSDGVDMSLLDGSDLTADISWPSTGSSASAGEGAPSTADPSTVYGSALDAALTLAESTTTLSLGSEMSDDSLLWSLGSASVADFDIEAPEHVEDVLDEMMQALGSGQVADAVPMVAAQMRIIDVRAGYSGLEYSWLEAIQTHVSLWARSVMHWLVILSVVSVYYLAGPDRDLSTAVHFVVILGLMWLGLRCEAR